MARKTAGSASPKPAAKKAAAKKAAPKKAAAKKAVAKKATAKKAAPKKAAAKKVTKKVTAKKAAAKKVTKKVAKKATAKKAAPKKAAKKATAKKAAPKKAAKKAAPKKAAKKAAAPKAAKKATAKAAAPKAAVKKAAPRAKKSASAAAPASPAAAKSDTASEPAAPEQTEGARGRGSVSRPKSPTTAPQVVVGPELRRRAASVRRILGERWPSADSELRSRNPFEMLCATLMAAQCTDKKVNEIAPLLFAQYPDAAALAQADIEEVKRIIHSTGFFNNKAKALLGMAQRLVQLHGGQVPGRMEDLVQLPGVGRKTAWCVLGRYFGQQGHIVDTHFARVTARLGFHSESDPVRIEQALDDLVPQDERLQFTHSITLHGRYVCQAKKPQCAQCPLRPLCPSAGLDEAA